MSERKALSCTRQENYAQWYQDVISAAELAQHSPVRGCMVVRPWGYGIWENIQRYLDRRIKETGHENAYFPLLIPVSSFEKEAQHVSGFATECAVVTHHRLKLDELTGKLQPDGELEEPFVIRPTSEMIIGDMFAQWAQSYRDLPIMINQWANVMRWEMRTRLFLRTSEILWQEGHTAHATEEEARQETRLMLSVYKELCENVLAVPVIAAEKPIFERFPGAKETWTIEAMMQDGKALQSGTSHFMGQNFAHACNICFTNAQEELEHAWTTSWGVTTRLIGAAIMVHSDDNGLVLPPRLAPAQVVILPILKKGQEQEVLDACAEITAKLQETSLWGEPLRVRLDSRDIGGGVKKWSWIKKGAPLRLEIGPKDCASGTVVISQRLPDEDLRHKTTVQMADIALYAQTTLLDMQEKLFERAQKFRDEAITRIHSKEELDTFLAQHDQPGFMIMALANDPSVEHFLKERNITARCIVPENHQPGCCVATGHTGAPLMYVAKAY